LNQWFFLNVFRHAAAVPPMTHRPPGARYAARGCRSLFPPGQTEHGGNGQCSILNSHPRGRRPWPIPLGWELGIENWTL